MAHVHLSLTILVLSWISIACAAILVSGVGRGDSRRSRRCILLRWVWICEGLTRMVVDLFIAMTLGPQPYYWPTDASYGSSPPIATRSGWMALALLPFVL